MPLNNVRYRVKQTSKGPVRLAFKGSTVVEAKNLKSGAVHTSSDFKKDRLKAKAKGRKLGT